MPRPKSDSRGILSNGTLDPRHRCRRMSIGDTATPRVHTAAKDVVQPIPIGGLVSFRILHRIALLVERAIQRDSLTIW